MPLSAPEDDEALGRWQAAMPPGWEAVRALDSRIYFWNRQTGSVSWDPPRPSPPPPPARPPPTAPPPPETEAGGGANSAAQQASTEARAAVSVPAGVQAPSHGGTRAGTAGGGQSREGTRGSGLATTKEKPPAGRASRGGQVWSEPINVSPLSPQVGSPPRPNVFRSADLPPAGVPTYKDRTDGFRPASRSAGAGLAHTSPAAHPEWAAESERERRAAEAAADRRQAAASAWETAQHSWVDKEKARARAEEEEEERERLLQAAASVRSESARRRVAEQRRAEVEEADAAVREMGRRVWMENEPIARRNRCMLTGEEDHTFALHSGGAAPPRGKQEASPVGQRPDVAKGSSDGAGPNRFVAEEEVETASQAPWDGNAACASDSALAPSTRSAVSAAAAAQPEPNAPVDPAPPRRPPEAWSIDVKQLAGSQPSFRRLTNSSGAGSRKRPSSPPITVVAPARPPPARAASPPVSSPPISVDEYVEPTRADSPMHQPAEDMSATLPPTAAEPQADLFGTRPAWAEITATVEPATTYDSLPSTQRPQDEAAPAVVTSTPQGDAHSSFNPSEAWDTTASDVGASVADPKSVPDPESEAASVLEAIDSFLAGDLAHHFMSGSA